ncbi:hypothetical protein ABNX05_01660 [Lysinibacillus sp. M3]|uniref:Uncharacterized protein n=1 Tax=Lysinibacillus zambalensis TaxID=3160866 RepID=A0ABV1MLC5_9BACI
MTIACRHCNASEGFFVRARVSGSATTYYTKTGDFMADQSSMYGNLSSRRHSSLLYELS